MLVGTVDKVPVSVPEEMVFATAELGAVVDSLIARGSVGASIGAAVATRIGAEDSPYWGIAVSPSSL